MEVFFGVRKRGARSQITRGVASFTLLFLALDLLLPAFKGERSDGFKSILIFQNRINEVLVFCNS